MHVAVRELAPGVADANDRLALEPGRPQALGTKGGAANEGFIFRPAEPAGAAKFLGIAHAAYHNKP